MKRFAILGVALIVAAPVLGAAQTDKAAALLADAHKAIGAKALQNLKTLSVEASVRRDVGQMQLDSDVQLVMELPDKYAKSETMTRGPASSTSTTGFNGDTAIQRFSAPAGGGMMIFRMGGPGAAPMGGKPGNDVTPEQKDEMNKAAVRAAKADVSRLMLGWFAMASPSIGATYSYAGEAVSPDGKADAIDVTGADGFAARLFIDQQTHLQLMVTYTAPKPRIVTISRGRGEGDKGRGEAKPPPEDLQKQAQAAANQPPEMADYTIYFDDWRDVDGVKFPYTIKRAMSGTTAEEWTVKKIRINPAIDAKAFDVEGS